MEIEVLGVHWGEPFKDFRGRQRIAPTLGHDSDVFVQNGKFRSKGILANKTAYAPGQYKVHFFAYFNGAWQSKALLQTVGDGGKLLKGKIFKKEDPDVLDSDLLLDYATAIAFPPPSPETQAIDFVKRATLSVPELGRSSMNIQDSLDYFMSPGTGITHGTGWSAKQQEDGVYMVTFNFTDGTAGAADAIWSVDLKTKKVQYINKSAKIFSWVPKD